MSRAGHEARGAVSDALATSLGQGVCFAAGLFFSVYVPRLLGAVNFGEWMLFRGLALFWISLLSMGDREVMSSFYVPYREQNPDQASRVFKSLVAVRLTLLPAGLVGALLMLYFSSSVYRTPNGMLCLAATVILKNLQSNLCTLIFGQRRLGWVAVVEGVQAVLVPLLVLVSFGDGRVAWIPRAAVTADALIFALAWGVSRWRQEWRSGWLPWHSLIEIVRYAAAIAMASSVIVSLNNLLLYLMNLRGNFSAVLGWVGLSTRCAWVVQAGLIAVATALMPILATVQVRHGPQHMFRWQNFISRLGLVLLLLLIGNILIVGPFFVRHVWGADFAPVALLLVGSLLAVIPIWLGSQWIRQFLLQRSTRVYVQAALLYAGVLCSLFFLLPADEGGWTPILAVGGASVVLAAYTAVHAARQGAALSWLWRFVPAVLWLAAAWAWAGGDTVSVADGLRLVAWNGGFILWIVVPQALGGRDVTALAQELARRLGWNRAD